MADRYRGYAAPGRPNPYGNPARASLPSSVGYSSRYAGDMHVLPSPRHPMTMPRGYVTTTNPSGVPTTMRTYAVTHDPRDPRARRDGSRTRRSTLDSAPRPPVIVTTSQKDRSNAASAHSSNNRSTSPYGDDYRGSEGQFYSQPASGRSRYGHPSSAIFDSDDYSTRWIERDRADSAVGTREAVHSRNSRPTVVYPSDPRHSSVSTTVDYGPEDYQYTNAGELAKWDLDHTRPSSRARRRESYDKGYYRPAVNYNPDQRTISVNPSQEPSRSYATNASRYYDNRGGPPPSTRGFASIHRGYEPPRDVPPAAPAPPAPTPASHVDVGSGISTRRTGNARPVSLYQEEGPHSVHHDDFYRSQEEERTMRGLPPRDREGGRAYDEPHYRDDDVSTRGFGIRPPTVDNVDDRRDRWRDNRHDEPLKRTEDRRGREEDFEREDRHRTRLESRDGHGDRRDDRGERREPKKGSDDEKDLPSRSREKGAVGLGLATAAVSSMAATVEDEDRPSRDDRESRRLKGSDEYKPGAGQDRETSRSRDWDNASYPDHRVSKSESQPAGHISQEPVERSSGEGLVASPQESDEPRGPSRAHRRSRSFNPNDSLDLQELKQELAAMKSSEKSEKPQDQGDEAMAMVKPERGRSRSSSPTKDYYVMDNPRDESQSRGRESSIAPPGNKQVRVLSPPRDNKEERPLRGILKAPKSSFPEEANPVREGVAPHKEDKKVKEAPPGARWTKINRKIVNPEALTIGKERFEVRDDFVIVLRVLSKEEIQAYAAATAVLRERRRNGEDGTRDKDTGKERDEDEDEDEGRRRHRHRRHKDDEGDEHDKDRGHERDSERRRRYRREEDAREDEGRSKDAEHHHHHHHHKSYRERERALEV